MKLLLPAVAVATLFSLRGPEPPPGPPWQLTYRDAREHALRAGQPVFVYFTKTYCPHCVPVDAMLSREELEPLYPRVTWLFVSRNFQGDAKDREALRTHDRFGISSWPQLVVFDPRTDEVVAEPPRDLKGFSAVLERAAKNDSFRPVRSPRPAEPRDASTNDVDDTAPIATRFDSPDSRTRAIALEDATLAMTATDEGTKAPPLPPEAVAKRLLDPKEDIVVRVRALRYLRVVAPALVAEQGVVVLDLPNDPIRYEFLDVIKEHPNPALSPRLVEIFRGAGSTVPSRNPNVLRMHAAQALASSGTADAADALRPLAVEANPLNSTTRIVDETLGAIGARSKAGERKAIEKLLLDAFPAGGDDPHWGANPREGMPRIARSLAESVRAALVTASGDNDLPALPASWTMATRETYLRELRKALH